MIMLRLKQSRLSNLINGAVSEKKLFCLHTDFCFTSFFSSPRPINTPPLDWGLSIAIQKRNIYIGLYIYIYMKTTTIKLSWDNLWELKGFMVDNKIKTQDQAIRYLLQNEKRRSKKYENNRCEVQREGSIGKLEQDIERTEVEG
jgi:hypothetical protein